MLFRGFNFQDRSPQHHKPKQSQFYVETNCIVYLFEQFLPKFHFDDVNSVRFECYPNAELACQPVIMDGLLPVTIPYDVSDFYQLSDLEKKKKTLDLMMDGLRVICKDKGWDEELFLYAYQKVVEKNYTFKKTYKKPKSSPNRKLKAKIEIEIGIYDCTASLVVEDKEQKHIYSEALYQEKPIFELLYPLLGDIKWVGNDEVRVHERKPCEHQFKTVYLH
ncbi:hypothetical protein [Planococcus plakortidis]|uniref:hypothetical protein n=1 Tax=Planococcus plakortidis TaxID=1038856 RepID=UPI00398534AD